MHIPLNAATIDIINMFIVYTTSSKSFGFRKLTRATKLRLNTNLIKYLMQKFKLTYPKLIIQILDYNPIDQNERPQR